MNRHQKKAAGKWMLAALWRYLILFAVMSFVVTNCMLLFLNQLQRELGLEYTRENIRYAAALTFGNVVLLSMCFVVIDTVLRRYTVDRPVSRIIHAAERIMNGEFSARIQPLSAIHDADGFNIIISYFNQMAQELSGIETLRTDFISNVSHELKTPLAVIQNYGTMLQNPGLPEEKRIEYAKAVTGSARRLADLITNILKLNRLENQQIYPEQQTYNLGEQLCECLLGFESMWEKKEIEIDTDMEEDVLIDSDAELLTLVWNNLFSNAMKFTEREGRVSLALKTEEDFAVVQVSDTGCGISPEVGRHIFEKFYQGDTSHSTQGNGLGLALVKKVIDIIGGDIIVQSEAGKGSTFTVRVRRNRDGTV